jgi:hypothetical protein
MKPSEITGGGLVASGEHHELANSKARAARLTVLHSRGPSCAICTYSSGIRHRKMSLRLFGCANQVRLGAELLRMDLDLPTHRVCLLASSPLFNGRRRAEITGS